MDEKQTIIHNVDVSECTYSKIGINKKCYCEQDLYDTWKEKWVKTESEVEQW